LQFIEDSIWKLRDKLKFGEGERSTCKEALLHTWSHQGVTGLLYLEHFSTHLYFMLCIEGFMFGLFMYLTMSCE
jgi:hypothetical protein